MQKITFLLALLGAILGLYAVTHSGGGMTPTKTETVAERVLRTGTIRCGYNTWAHYFEKDLKTGKYKGFIYDIMMEVGKRLSLKIEWTEEAPWDAALTGITTGRYDMFCFPLYINGNRSREAMFSMPIAYLPAYVLMRADDQRYSGNDPSDLNNTNYTMAFLDGEISGILSNQLFPNAKKHAVSQAQGFSIVIQDIASKKADFTVNELSTIDDYNAKNTSKLKSVGPPIFTNPFAYPLPQDSHFKSIIDGALTEMQLDGFIKRTFEKHNYAKNVVMPIIPYQEK